MKEISQTSEYVVSYIKTEYIMNEIKTFNIRFHHMEVKQHFNLIDLINKLNLTNLHLI